VEFEYAVEIVQLLASPIHRYEGRPADGPLSPAGPELHNSVAVRAGLGIVGDRFFGRPAHLRASVTVMAAESLEGVQQALGLERPVAAEGARRNILLRGVNVDALPGARFSIDGIEFAAHRPARPCAWMDVALAPGAFRALRGRGGVRCEPLTSGTLTLGPAILRSSVDLSFPDLAPALF